MITLLQNGAWLLNGQEIVEDTADSTTILNSKLCAGEERCSGTDHGLQYFAGS